jgi:hypothetical protein
VLLGRLGAVLRVLRRPPVCAVPAGLPAASPCSAIVPSAAGALLACVCWAFAVRGSCAGEGKRLSLLRRPFCVPKWSPLHALCARLPFARTGVCLHAVAGQHSHCTHCTRRAPHDRIHASALSSCYAPVHSAACHACEAASPSRVAPLVCEPWYSLALPFAWAGDALHAARRASQCAATERYLLVMRFDHDACAERGSVHNSPPRRRRLRLQRIKVAVNAHHGLSQQCLPRHALAAQPDVVGVLRRTKVWVTALQ